MNESYSSNTDSDDEDFCELYSEAEDNASQESYMDEGSQDVIDQQELEDLAQDAKDVSERMEGTNDHFSEREMDKQGDIITRGMGGEDADYSFKSMIKNYVRIATLNARSILKVANPQHQKSYTKYLRSKQLDLDIICLQEVTPHQPTKDTSCQLTSKQSKRLEMSFNNKDMIYTKHCAVICLNQKYHLTSSGIAKDGRCIFSTLIDTQNNNICNLITWLPSRL